MTEPTPLGDLLLDLAGGARQTALLCAPFVKIPALARVLAAIDAGVRIELFTRWRPEEVAAGVSDTGTLALIQEREGTVFLRDPLHAKLFLVDERGLVGSANLTNKALGWSQDPNIELLVEVAADFPEIEALVTDLRANSVVAHQGLASEIEQVAAQLPKTLSPPTGEQSQTEFQSQLWWPNLREPRDLFIAYTRGAEQLSKESAASAAQDLAYLEIPAGFDRDQFDSLVGTRLLQAPLIRRIDELLSRSRRFGEIRQLFAETFDLDRYGADYAWQTSMRWLLYFLPDHYERTVPSHSEIMVRKEVHP